MILERIKQEENSDILAGRRGKIVNQFRSRGLSSNFKLLERHTIQQYVTSPDDKRMTKSPEARPARRCSGSSEGIESTCSNFMKSYVQKLKRQRKREKKRLSDMKRNKGDHKQGGLGWDIAPFPLIHHGKQQILIFQRINPSCFKSDTIRPAPSASTISNQKISDILNEIKFQKERASKGLRKGLSEGFPLLKESVQRKKGKKLLSIQNLDPWQGESGVHQILLQQ